MAIMDIGIISSSDEDISQTRSNQQIDDYSDSTVPYNNILLSDVDSSISTDDFLQMDIIQSGRSSAYHSNKHRFENTIEAKVEPGDTLQAIALRFHCTVSDIRRLNKIDKDNEIHARKIIKIPVTVHNVLLDNLPIVHKSGNNSPRPEPKSSNGGSRDSVSGLSSIIRNPLEDAEAMLSEKLMVASVNCSGINEPSTSRAALANTSNINSIILNSKFETNVYSDEASNLDDISAPLITDILDDSTNVPNLHRIPGPSTQIIDFSDCDMSWICLLVLILALCVMIPIAYIVYITEHAHHTSISPQ